MVEVYQENGERFLIIFFFKYNSTDLPLKLSDEGLVPEDMSTLDDHHPGEPSTHYISNSRYFYTDETGAPIPWRLEEGDFYIPGNHVFRM